MGRFGRAKAWATELWANHSLVDAAKGAYQGVKGGYQTGMAGGVGLRGGLLGDRSWRMAASVGGGAAAGAIGGGMASDDHRVRGALAGGLLGAGAGYAGKLGWNNRAGLRGMYGMGRAQAGLRWNKI